jgi:flagellar biosynthesis GTPase FlhF
MKRKELFDALKNVILGEEKQKFYDVKTTDGKILRIDGDILEKGKKVYEILEDGTVAAINDDDYILETGETVMVRGNEVYDFIPVTAEEVVEEEPATEETPAEEAPATEQATSTEIVEEIASAETVEEVSDEMNWDEAVKALAEEIASLKESITEMKKSAQTMREHIEKFSKLPAENGIEKEKTGFKTNVEKEKDLKQANLDKIRNLRINK